MPRLESFIANEKDPLLLVLARWTTVVGRRNRKVLFPKGYDEQKRVLRIAVPNSMVRAQYEPLLSLIIEKMAQVVPEIPVEKIILSVEPRHFENEKKDGKCRGQNNVPREADPEKVALAQQRLLEKGIPPRLAATLAQIEVMITQKRDADR